MEKDFIPFLYFGLNIHVDENHHLEPQKNWDKPFWRGVVSSEYGTPSTARVSTLLIVLVTLIIVEFLIIKTGKIPDHLIDLGIFSALLIAVVYAPSKLVNIFKSFFSNRF
ncbi:Uncharacterised protein [uncultured archaeon]|nr:Uncharacterised protein [uncultured archaeon]